MSLDLRSFAIATAGFCAFINLYSPQALLPELANEFHVGPSVISTLMTASTAGDRPDRTFYRRAGRYCRAQAPHHGGDVCDLRSDAADDFRRQRFADVAFCGSSKACCCRQSSLSRWRISAMSGRKAMSRGLRAFTFPAPASADFAGASLPAVLADLIGWRAAFGVVAVLTLISAIIVALTLTRERHFVRVWRARRFAAFHAEASARPAALATYAIGFGVLFNFIATFTYISFHLAAPPYLFTPTLLGALFLTYLAAARWCRGSGAAWRCSDGGRSCSASWPSGSSACSCCWRAPIGVILTGLTLCAVCGMLCQAISTGYVTHDRQGRPLVRCRALCDDVSISAAAPAHFSAVSPGRWRLGRLRCDDLRHAIDYFSDRCDSVEIDLLHQN